MILVHILKKIHFNNIGQKQFWNNFKDLPDFTWNNNKKWIFLKVFTHTNLTVIAVHIFFYFIVNSWTVFPALNIAGKYCIKLQNNWTNFTATTKKWLGWAFFTFLWQYRWRKGKDAKDIVTIECWSMLCQATRQSLQKRNLSLRTNL